MYLLTLNFFFFFFFFLLLLLLLPILYIPILVVPFLGVSTKNTLCIVTDFIGTSSNDIAQSYLPLIPLFFFSSNTVSLRGWISWATTKVELRYILEECPRYIQRYYCGNISLASREHTTQVRYNGSRQIIYCINNLLNINAYVCSHFRDLASRNILLRSNLEPLIADFGNYFSLPIV